jgi:hypothetical protein
MWIEGVAYLVKKLGAVKTALLDTGKIGLIKTPVAFDTATTLAIVAAAECTFTGYARKTLTLWGTAFIAPDGVSANSIGPQSVWTMTDEVDPNTIVGYFLLDKDGAYLGGEMLADPIPLAHTGQQAAITPVAIEKNIA